MMNVSKKYGKGILAVNNLSVRIQDGEFVYVVGPSGAGKSTFIKMMYRQEKATKGRITVGKYDLTKMREREIPLVNLTHRMTMFPDQLSGGEQQRVAIARAIVNTPAVLIADEPTGNLDPETSMEIMDILERINQQGTTIVMATHNSQIVNEKKHRVLAIEMGRIVRDQEEGEYGYED